MDYDKKQVLKAIIGRKVREAEELKEERDFRHRCLVHGVCPECTKEITKKEYVIPFLGVGVETTTYTCDFCGYSEKVKHEAWD